MERRWLEGCGSHSSSLLTLLLDVDACSLNLQTSKRSGEDVADFIDVSGDLAITELESSESGSESLPGPGRPCSERHKVSATNERPAALNQSTGTSAMADLVLS